MTVVLLDVGLFAGVVLMLVDLCVLLVDLQVVIDVGVLAFLLALLALVSLLNPDRPGRLPL